MPIDPPTTEDSKSLGCNVEAYGLVDAHRLGTLTYADAIAELAHRRPGYAQDEFERAFSDALFASR